RLRAVLAARQEDERALVGLVAFLETRRGERLERHLDVREVRALLVPVAVAAVERMVGRVAFRLVGLERDEEVACLGDDGRVLGLLRAREAEDRGAGRSSPS